MPRPWLGLLVIIGCGARTDRGESVPPRTADRIIEPDAAPLTVASDPPERCSIRVTERGLLVDGDMMKREHAVALCKQRAGALVDVADEAPRANGRSCVTS